MDASAVVPNTAPACVPENFRVIVKYVPMVTYQQPQTTKFRNIMMLRRMLTELGIGGCDQAIEESNGSANVGFLLGSGRFALDRDGAGVGKLIELANDFGKIDSALADRHFLAELFRIGRIQPVFGVQATHVFADDIQRADGLSFAIEDQIGGIEIDADVVEAGIFDRA